jgi:hypothetical protein
VRNQHNDLPRCHALDKYTILGGLDKSRFGLCIPGCFIVLGILRPHDKKEPSMMSVYDLGTTKKAESGILLAQFDDSGPLDKIIINERVFDVKLLRTYAPWRPSETKKATEGHALCSGRELSNNLWGNKNSNTIIGVPGFLDMCQEKLLGNRVRSNNGLGITRLP